MCPPSLTAEEHVGVVWREECGGGHTSDYVTYVGTRCGFRCQALSNYSVWVWALVMVPASDLASVSGLHSPSLCRNLLHCPSVPVHSLETGSKPSSS